MTFRINATFDADGTRRAELECEPASDDEVRAARLTFIQVLRLLAPDPPALTEAEQAERDAALTAMMAESERLKLYKP